VPKLSPSSKVVAILQTARLAVVPLSKNWIARKSRLADDPLEHFIADIGGGDRALRRQLVKGHFLAKCLAPRLTGRIARIRDGRQQPVGVFGEPLLRFRFGVVALFDRGHFGLTRTLTRFPPLRGLRRHLRIERAAVAWSTHD